MEVRTEFRTFCVPCVTKRIGYGERWRTFDAAKQDTCSDCDTHTMCRRWGKVVSHA